MDQPQSHQLLRAMSDALTTEVMPACDPGPRHIARVVANLCQVLAREAEADTSLDTAELAAQLDEQLRAGNPTDAAADQAMFEQLLASTERRLAIAKPQYRVDTQRAHGS